MAQASTVLIGNSTLPINTETGEVTYFIIHVAFTDKPLKYECFEIVNDGRKAMDVSNSSCSCMPFKIIETFSFSCRLLTI